MPDAPTQRTPTQRPAAQRSLPRSSAPAGALALTDRFFDRFPDFLETSQTVASSQARLDLRHAAIVQHNSELFPGARVLDIASHDGRWSMAATDAGAAHVIGVEGRADMVEDARSHFERAGIAADRYRFVAGDVFEVLAREDIEVDVVMCLGFLYHTLRYNELFALIRKCRPRHLVIDTEVYRVDAGPPVIRIGRDDVSKPQNAIADDSALDGKMLVGRPTVKALRLLCEANGYVPDRLADWAGLIRDNPDLRPPRDYRDGSRVTLTCHAR